ncbi:MAG: PilZ domain-containing protein [Elusimicrobia bacterium]|nr:PilZ domain-containing protein [Elusimicrobiota bacterium]
MTTIDVNSECEKRNFIRHMADMPIEIHLQDIVAHRTEYLNEISFGGLSFRSTVAVPIDTLVDIRIPLVRPVFSTQGKVIWCRPDAADKTIFDVGVEFVDKKDSFKIRMLEQICHIEDYKKELAAQAGQPVTGEQAALEWIRKYADKFPRH